ncbi:MAG TPA: HAD family phosphatase [Candidatus Thermoplasmatota archaeon]|nr:HAD family phosphatase [Candidatus Thermoplasmatota archaeon]
MPTPTHRSAREDAMSLADGWLQVVSTHHQDPRDDVDRDAASHGQSGLELVLLDMDGTLVHGSTWEVLHEHFGVSNETNWLRYQRGELNDHEFVKSDVALWRIHETPVHVDEIDRILHQHARVMDGAKALVDALRARRIATCIVSGGLDLLARRVCLELGIDMYVANGLKLRDSGHLAGEGVIYVEIKDKGRTTREILKKLGVPRERTAAVGNSAYDVPMFREAGFGIAFNPSDPWVRRAARHVVEGQDISKVIPYL